MKTEFLFIRAFFKEHENHWLKKYERYWVLNHDITAESANIRRLRFTTILQTEFKLFNILFDWKKKTLWKVNAVFVDAGKSLHILDSLSALKCNWRRPIITQLVYSLSIEDFTCIMELLILRKSIEGLLSHKQGKTTSSH